MSTKRKATKKAVAKKNGSALAVLEDAFEAAAGMGLEDIKAEDLAIPTIKCADSLSDEMKPNHAKHMPDLKVRDIFNDVTKQIWSGAEGILVIPVYYRLSYCAYLPDRGGFVGEVSATEYATCERDGYKDILPNGNDCERTANHYVKIVHDDGSLESALIRMQKTKLKKSRQWNTIMMLQNHNGAPLPSFANIYRLTTASEGNKKGEWTTWSVSLEKRVESMDDFNNAKEFHAGILKGDVQTSSPPPDPENSGSEASSEEIPF
jgi:hypothetical protein